MKKKIEEIQEENRNLRKELELVKNKFSTPCTSDLQKKNGNIQTTKSSDKETRKEKKKEGKSRKNTGSIKRIPNQWSLH